MLNATKQVCIARPGGLEPVPGWPVAGAYAEYQLPARPSQCIAEERRMTGSWKLGAFTIILDADRRVLLCHRRDLDLWNLRGGGVESRETPWDGVVREVREEMGLVVAIER